MSKICVFLFCLVWCFISVSSRLHITFTETKCTQPKGDICVEIRQCPYFADLLDRSSIPRPRNVIRVIRERQCGFSGNTPKVCCDITPSTTTTTAAPMMDGYSNEMSYHRNYKLLPIDICGPISTDSRITSGSTVDMAEFPWMSLIAYETSSGIDFRCGGTVINERYVLTAAHCVLNSTIIGIRLGEHNMDTKDDCENGECAPPVQDFYIEEITIHEEYNPKTYVNDIALIRLATPANFSNYNVQPICLPVGTAGKMNLNGKFGTVSGWGITEDGYKSSKLLKVSIPVLPISNCQKVYERFAPITYKQICAGGKMGRDSCGGDSGGPMKYVGTIDGTPRYVQYGIVSYGPRHCGTEGQPGIYTKVSSYVEWILDHLKPS